MVANETGGDKPGSEAERDAADKLQRFALRYMADEDMHIEEVLAALDEWLETRGALPKLYEVREVQP